jgi:hypothetical protein
MRNRSNNSVNTSSNRQGTENSNKVSRRNKKKSAKPVGHTQGSTGGRVPLGTGSTSGGTDRSRAHQVQRFRAGRARRSTRKNKSQQSCGTPGQFYGTQSTVLELGTVLTVKLTVEPLTFCLKPEHKNINNKKPKNSKKHQKSKKGNQTKPFGAKQNKTKGYTKPQEEFFGQE